MKPQKQAIYIMDILLRLLHPFMPFITEELWHRIHSMKSTNTNIKSIMISEYPKSSIEVLASKLMQLGANVYVILSKSAQKLLTRELNIPDDHIYVAQGFVGINDFTEIINNLPKQNIFFI